MRGTSQRKLQLEMAALFAAKTPFLIIDTETTGFLDNPDGQIVELSCVNQAGEVVFTSLVKPDCDVPMRVSAIHGLTTECLADSPTFVQIWPQLLEVLSQYQVIYAYNVDFDRGMLFKTAERFNLEIPGWLKEQEWKCMQKRYAEYHGDWSEWHQSYTFKKLSVACHNLSVQMSEEHRATGDALSTYALMRALAAKVDRHE